VQFLSSEFPPVPREQAQFHIIPVPWEASVSYGGGTAGGPEAIITASDQLEAWDGQDCPGDRGMCTLPAVDCTGTVEEVFSRISATVEETVRMRMPDGGTAIPVMIGGEHSITAAAWDGVCRGVETLPGIVQIDAHADLRDRYEGNPFSHASVIHRIHSSSKPTIFQVGVRALCQEEATYRSRYAGAKAGSIHWRDAAGYVPPGSPGLELPVELPDSVYLTVDIDGLDPSVCPATGTPVPGGLSWYQALACIELVCRQRRVIACDIVEHAPIPGWHGPDYTAAELVYRIIGLIGRYSLPSPG
jgi:agmatinase